MQSIVECKAHEMTDTELVNACALDSFDFGDDDDVLSGVGSALAHVSMELEASKLENLDFRDNDNAHTRNGAVS